MEKVKKKTDNLLEQFANLGSKGYFASKGSKDVGLEQRLHRKLLVVYLNITKTFDIFFTCWSRAEHCLHGRRGRQGRPPPGIY